MNKTSTKGQPKPKMNFNLKFIDEKIAIVFLLMKNKDQVSLEAFCRRWSRMWPEDYRIENGNYGKIQYAEVSKRGEVTQKYLGRYLSKLYDTATQNYGNLTSDQIEKIRTEFRERRAQEDFDKLSKLACEKGLSVFISNNPNELSGYRIELIEKKNRCIAGATFDLTFDEAERDLLKIAPFYEINKQEEIIVAALKSSDTKQQENLVQQHRPPYSTHNFDVAINNLLFRRKTPLSFGIIMKVTDMCIRLNIKNMSNGKPIRLLSKEAYDSNARKKHNRKINKSKPKQKPVSSNQKNKYSVA